MTGASGGTTRRCGDVPTASQGGSTVHHDDITEAVRSTIACLHLDLFAVDVIERLEQAGIQPILLKGPAVAVWLYAERGGRSYGDVDLLVSPDDWLGAIEVLEFMGLSDPRAGESHTEKSGHAAGRSATPKGGPSTSTGVSRGRTQPRPRSGHRWLAAPNTSAWEPGLSGCSTRSAALCTWRCTRRNTVWARNGPCSTSKEPSNG